MSDVILERSADSPLKPVSVAAYTVLPPSSALHRWAQELRSALSGQARFDATDWQLLGHAVMLECSRIEEVPALLAEVAATAGMTLHVFHAARVMEVFLPWIEELAPDEPAMVYLVPGDWMAPSSPASFLECSNAESRSCTDAFLHAVQGVLKGLGMRPVVLVTAVNGFDQLSPRLRQVGYFDRRIHVPEWTANDLAKDFLHELGSDLADDSLLARPERVGALLKSALPDRRRRNLTALALKRLACREQRRICFGDLAQMATQGTTEDDPFPTDDNARYRTAVHEAGHALVSHLDSSTMVAPTLCTAIRSRDCDGRMVVSFEAPESRGDDLSIANIRHKIRMLLAGRAAEHLVLGVDDTSATGAGSDLDKATGLAFQMFAEWGIALETDTVASQAANLVTVTNGGNPSDDPRIVGMARQCLQAEFLKTTEILRKHRTYLDRIVQALCQQDVLLQEDFECLWAECTRSCQRGGAGSAHPPQALTWSPSVSH